MSKPVFNPGQAISINPSLFDSEDQQPQGQNEFSALVLVKSSRYTPLVYNNTDIPAKIAIEWVMETTKGNTFKKQWSTGLNIGSDEKPPLATISTDGKRLISASPDFKGLNLNSDGMFFLKKALSSGFPENVLTDDISVFEGHCFFIATDVNPRSQGSSRKPYPKQYHPEGWQKALADVLATRAAREASQANSQAQIVSSFTPPQVVSGGGNVQAAAADALLRIVTNAGKPVTRAGILAGLNALDDVKSWTPDFRQDVTLALWDSVQLASIIKQTPTLKFEGDSVSLK